MIKKNQSKINVFNALTDFVIIIISIFASMAFRFEVLDGVLNISYKTGSFAIAAILFGVVIVGMYYAFGLYTSFRFKRIGIDNLRILVLNGVATVVLAALLFVFKIQDLSRLALVIFWILASVLIIAKRNIVRLLVRRWRKKGYNQKHFVIVGNGPMARQFVSDVNDNPQFGVTIDGYISGVEKKGLGKCLGKYEDMETLLTEHDYDGLIVALEPHEYDWMKEVLRVAGKVGIKVEMIPFYNDYFPSNPTIEKIGETKLINMRATPLDNIGWSIVKRAMDIFISLIAIIITSPVMIAVAIGVKLSSPGPVFFKQVRVGRNQKNFRMLKFRSMRIDTDNTGWSTAVDNRRTKFGSFIRKFSLDELPQFFNVFIGQMSVVGPRPELPKFVEQFKEDVPMYLVRHQVRPGISGWSQVNGLRGDTSITERVKSDIWYIENWTLWLDIKIILKTIFGGFVNQEKMK